MLLNINFFVLVFSGQRWLLVLLYVGVNISALAVIGVYFVIHETVDLFDHVQIWLVSVQVDPPPVVGSGSRFGPGIGSRAHLKVSGHRCVDFQAELFPIEVYELTLVVLVFLL